MDFTIIFHNFQRFILANFGKENRNAQIFLQISFMAARHRLFFSMECACFSMVCAKMP